MKTLVFNRILALGVVATALLSSCSKENNTSTETAMNVRASIEQQNAESRATASKENFQHGDQIGLWVVPFRVTAQNDTQSDEKIDLRPTGNYKDNVLFTYNSTSSSFTSTETIYYVGVTNKMDVYAVSPYDSKMSAASGNTMTDPEAYEFTISEDQSSAAAVQASDFLSAQEVADPTIGAVDLTFKHRLTRILVAFTIPATYDNQAVTSVQSVEFLNQRLKTLINVADVSAAPTQTSSSNPQVGIKLLQAQAPSAGAVAGDYVYECIIAPGFTVNADDDLLRINIELANSGDPTELIVKAVAQTTFSHQSQYNINVQLADRSEANLGTVQIAGWGESINVNANATKMHRMIFDVTSSSPATLPSEIATIEVRLADPNGTTVSSVSSTVTYTNDKFFISYDADGKVGGTVNRVRLYNSLGTLLTTLTPSSPMRITGDPSDQNYSDVIATLNFTSSGITMTPTEL